jgi:hypothetical protein
MSIPRKRKFTFILDLLITSVSVSALSSCKPDAPTPAAATPAGPAIREAAVPVPPVVKEKAKTDLAFELPGRTVNASVPEPGSIQGENGAVMIFSGSHRITIGVQRVMADGVEMMQMSAETKNLKLSLSDSGVLTVNRDGEAPATFQMPPPDTDGK